MKTLELQWAFVPRRGKRLDFVISGRSLYQELCRRGYDVVPRLGPKLIPVDSEMRGLLFLERKGDMPSGRVALYTCPECGDLGCGAVSVRITREKTDILWSEFGWENNYDKDLLPLQNLGPYRFREAEYRKAILTPPESD